MRSQSTKTPPGRVRDAILYALSYTSQGLSVRTIEDRVQRLNGLTPSSSVRSYLRLNTPKLFLRESRGVYRLNVDNLFGNNAAGIQTELAYPAGWAAPFVTGKTQLFHADCFDWLDAQNDNSIHAVVTDPPYGLHEYTPTQQTKLRSGKGGVWRIPPTFDGHRRSPLPRFTTLTEEQRQQIGTFFFVWTRLLLPKLRPGAHVVVASNPLLSHIVAGALSQGGLERRGEIIRLVMTMRGGDRPKGAHREFPNVSVMPRSMWEPWLLYRKPIEGRVQDNLRKWQTGGLRRVSDTKPFGDVIQSAPTHTRERGLAPHPSLKPQAFLRHVVRGVLPLGEGLIVDPFAGSGSTLAAAEAIGYQSIGIEKDKHYFQIARDAIPKLRDFRPHRSV